MATIYGAEKSTENWETKDFESRKGMKIYCVAMVIVGTIMVGYFLRRPTVWIAGIFVNSIIDEGFFAAIKLILSGLALLTEIAGIFGFAWVIQSVAKKLSGNPDQVQNPGSKIPGAISKIKLLTMQK